MDSTAYALVLTTLPFAVFTFDEQYTNLNFGVFLRDKAWQRVAVNLVVA
jgi:hypothetical protein